jgi:hypothetical protein
MLYQIFLYTLYIRLNTEHLQSCGATFKNVVTLKKLFVDRMLIIILLNVWRFANESPLL